MQGSATLIQSMYFDIMAGSRLFRNFESEETLNSQVLIILTTEREGGREAGTYSNSATNWDFKKSSLRKEELALWDRFDGGGRT